MSPTGLRVAGLAFSAGLVGGGLLMRHGDWTGLWVLGINLVALGYYLDPWWAEREQEFGAAEEES